MVWFGGQKGEKIKRQNLMEKFSHFSWALRKNLELELFGVRGRGRAVEENQKVGLLLTPIPKMYIDFSTIFTSSEADDLQYFQRFHVGKLENFDFNVNNSNFLAVRVNFS
jgi:hypothetical protein